MSIDRGMDKEDVHIYSAIKNYEIMSLAATWMDVEIVILTAVNQKQKGKYVISLICVI